MKSFLSTLLIGLCLWSCTDKDESVATGNIYGVVTVKSTAEPMRATGVELYYNNALLLKTVTYDDGHYEFVDLKAGTYELRVVAEGYVDVKFSVIVEAGRTARADMQLEEIDTGVTVLTLTPTVSSSKVSFKGEFRYQYTVDWPTEYGFVYGKGSNPTVNYDHIVKGTMTAEHGYFFIAEPTDLNSRETYYVRAYAKNKKGISYGEQRTFMISGNPVVSTLAATDIVDGSATMNGKIEYKGDPAYT
ncbi:MAG: carboxypeptidase-like regulatory domain-containing protein, partial [Alistipes sp.]|nr:carboxypeptidase-like regulatory domain-containing protein [Alistipes sp.]